MIVTAGGMGMVQPLSPHWCLSQEPGGLPRGGWDWLFPEGVSGLGLAYCTPHSDLHRVSTMSAWPWAL